MSDQERIDQMSKIITLLERLDNLKFVTPRNNDIKTRLEWALDNHAKQLYRGLEK